MGHKPGRGPSRIRRQQGIYRLQNPELPSGRGFQGRKIENPLILLDFADRDSYNPTQEERMNKTELVKAIAENANLKVSETEKMVNAFLDSVATCLKKKSKVTLVGFGTFSVRKRGARTGRNPRTGDTIKIKASKNPAFKAGKALKDAVN